MKFNELTQNDLPFYNVLSEVYPDMETLHDNQLLQSVASLMLRKIKQIGGNQETDYTPEIDGFPNTDLWNIVKGYPLPTVLTKQDEPIGTVRTYNRNLTIDVNTDPVKANTYRSYPYDITADASVDVVKTGIVENEKAHSLTTEGGTHSESELDNSVDTIKYRERVIDEWTTDFAKYFVKLLRTNASYF